MLPSSVFSMYRYQRLLEPAERYGRKRGLYTGLGTGFNWILSYSLNAIGLTYGTRLVLNDLDKPTEEKKYLVGIVFSVSILTSYLKEERVSVVEHSAGTNFLL